MKRKSSLERVSCILIKIMTILQTASMELTRKARVLVVNEKDMKSKVESCML